MDKKEETCETCVHERDSGSEFCGSCDLSSCWSEKPECVEDRISKRTNELEALCHQLAEALKAWQLFDTESPDKHPCPDAILRRRYHLNARQVTDAALEAAKKAGINP